MTTQEHLDSGELIRSFAQIGLKLTYRGNDYRNLKYVARCATGKLVIEGKIPVMRAYLQGYNDAKYCQKDIALPFCKIY